MRSNMDPWGRHDDAALWHVLRQVQLGGAVRKLGGLDARMAEAGNNLSVGQRQLLCLARWPFAQSLISHVKVTLICKAGRPERTRTAEEGSNSPRSPAAPSPAWPGIVLGEQTFPDVIC